MSTFRLGGMITSALALLVLVFLARDRFHQKHLADAAAQCAKASRSDEKPLTDCLPDIKTRLEADRQARTCEASLLPRLRPETRFAMAQSCGAGIKRLVADADTAQASAADLEGQLESQRSGELKAVARAEARAGNQQERDSHARKAIDAAPRDAAGSIHCDAVCLRAIGQ